MEPGHHLDHSATGGEDGMQKESIPGKPATCLDSPLRTTGDICDGNCGDQFGMCMCELLPELLMVNETEAAGIADSAHPQFIENSNRITLPDGRVVEAFHNALGQSTMTVIGQVPVETRTKDDTGTIVTRPSPTSGQVESVTEYNHSQPQWTATRIASTKQPAKSSNPTDTLDCQLPTEDGEPLCLCCGSSLLLCSCVTWWQYPSSR
jgi:hypothetical protein